MVYLIVKVCFYYKFQGSFLFRILSYLLLLKLASDRIVELKYLDTLPNKLSHLLVPLIVS